MNFIMQFWADLSAPKGWWQVVGIAISVLLSYLVSTFFIRRFPMDVGANGADIQTAQLFAKMRFSVVWLGLLCVAKFVLEQWQQHVHLLSLLISIIGALALIRFGMYLSRRIFVRDGIISHSHLLLEKIFSWGVWIAAILYYTGLLQSLWSFLELYTISFGRNKLSIADILQAIMWVVITVLFALWASAVLDRRLMKLNSLNMSLRIVLSRVGQSLLIICAILASLNLVGIDLTILSIFGGALGVGLGLGLQKIASNYVSGFIILLDRSLSIDDMITVDKYSGRVSKISTRYTVLKGLDGVESIIPNEMLISGPVQNLSLTDPEIILYTSVSVAYSTDLDVLLPKIVEVVGQVPRVSAKISPAANLVNFGANGLELSIGFWINDPENGRMSVTSQVNRAIWKLLREQNVEVPYPQTEIRILGRKT